MKLFGPFGFLVSLEFDATGSILVPSKNFFVYFS